MDRRIHAVGMVLECLFLARTRRLRRLYSTAGIPPAPDIRVGMSGNASITTGLPLGSDVAETFGERGVLTQAVIDGAG